MKLSPSGDISKSKEMEKKIPESFYIYRELLSKITRQKEELKKKYQFKIDSLTSEVDFLKEQIDAQNTMIAQTIEYMERLENQVNNMNVAIKEDKK